MVAPRTLVRLRPLIAPPQRVHRSTTLAPTISIAGSGFSARRPALPRPSVYRPRPQKRWQSGAAGGANDYQPGPANDLQPQPSTQHFYSSSGSGSSSGGSSGSSGSGGSGSSHAKGNHDGRQSHSAGAGKGAYAGGGGRRHAGTAWKMFESAATTTASLSILG